MKKTLLFGLLLSLSVFAMSCGDDPTCDDGEMNGNETGIDCGGDECAPCPSCGDGIQNGTETGIDCGGDECPVCPTCDDGIQNGTETGIDCGGDCAVCETTVAEDKANIQKTFDDLLTCVTDFKNSRSIDIFFRDFLNLTDGEALNEDWIDNLGENFDGVIDTDHIEDNSRIDLGYHAGSYVYDAGANSWTKVNNETDKMVFLFPSNPGATMNNVQLVLDKYEDKQATIDGETFYYPTAMHIRMDVDNQRMMEVDVANITYADNAEFEIPVEISATLFMDPINMTLNLTRVSTTEYKLNSTIEDGNSCVIGVEVDVELKDDDFENLGSDGFEKVHVKVNVGQMTIQSLADIATLIALLEDDDVTETQLNSLLDIDALFDGIKIADIEVSEEQETFLIFYKDLSSEDSKVYYESFWEDIKDLWTEFFG